VKSYCQFCGVAKALDLLGERWTLLIVRDLLLGPRRFTDLQKALHGITPNLLTLRLEHLKAHEIVERATAPEVHGRGYALTELGRSLEPAILALGAFGAKVSPKRAAGDSVDPRHAMLSLKRRYTGSSSRGVLALAVADLPFAIRFGGPHIEVRDGTPSEPDATLRGGFEGWFALLSRQMPLSVLEQQAKLTRSGSARVAQAFVRSIGALAR
jgi:DNA-binding HxlR family transcriptional regulator